MGCPPIVASRLIARLRHFEEKAADVLTICVCQGLPAFEPDLCWRAAFPIRTMIDTSGHIHHGGHHLAFRGSLKLIAVFAYELEDVSVIGGTDKWFDADPEWKPIETLRVIMKDGRIYKNAL